MESIEEAKIRTAYFMRRLYEKGLTTTSGGNISMRLADGTVIITPSASDKGTMSGSEIGRMDMDGKIIGKKFKPTIESRMHLQIYKNRRDVGAVVHAHPITASAIAASKAKINTRLLAESYAILGDIAYAKPYLMGSEELAEEVGKSLLSAQCVIMHNHGAIAVGKNLLEAFDRLEVLEAAAKITILHLSPLKGLSSELDDSSLDDIDKLMKRKK